VERIDDGPIDREIAVAVGRAHFVNRRGFS
jgi:hypothetical protein